MCATELKAASPCLALTLGTESRPVPGDLRVWLAQNSSEVSFVPEPFSALSNNSIVLKSILWQTGSQCKDLRTTTYFFFLHISDYTRISYLNFQLQVFPLITLENCPQCCCFMQLGICWHIKVNVRSKVSNLTERGAKHFPGTNSPTGLKSNPPAGSKTFLPHLSTHLRTFCPFQDSNTRMQSLNLPPCQIQYPR